MLKRLSGSLLLALVAIAVISVCGLAIAQKDKSPPKAVMQGGEWSPEGKTTAPDAFRGCLVNKTYSNVTLTIARPGFATYYPLLPGGHLRLWLYKGEAVFVAGDPEIGKITAFVKHDVEGETTVYIGPNSVTFARGVEECLKHPEK